MIEVIKDDITKLKVDAIVNAANTMLKPGSGVCGAIFDAAGIGLNKECDQIASCETGAAVMTDAYDIPVQKIIHTVGPVYFKHGSEAPNLLASCYQECLKLAVKEKLRSIAFPCISTGIYGYPKEEAAQVAIKTVREFQKHSPIRVIFCCFENEDFEIYNFLLG
jgi:O-acetyl-ADP-ribose deacetylase (regulator of RNase III)